MYEKNTTPLTLTEKKTDFTEKLLMQRRVKLEHGRN